MLFYLSLAWEHYLIVREAVRVLLEHTNQWNKRIPVRPMETLKTATAMKTIWKQVRNAIF